jgi:hypothetical protein
VTKFRKSPFVLDELLQVPVPRSWVTMPVPILVPAQVRIDERSEFWETLM